MKGLVLLFLLLCGHFTLAEPALMVTSVGRAGLPPYEDAERVYRLEGPGCQTLRVGEILVLRRQGERRSLGRLEIVTVLPNHAKARLSASGDTFPLKGDRALRMENVPALPQASTALQALATVDSLRPRVIAPPLVPAASQEATYREPIYFLKGDANLSPGALTKLKAWVGAWGMEGQWSLECPHASTPLATLRINALLAELQRLGVSGLEITSLPEEPSERYDAIFVKKEPW